MKALVLGLLLLAAPAFAQQPVSQANATATTATLQNAAVANGNGSTLNVNGMAMAVLTVNCASCGGGTQITFEASENQSNYVPRSAVLSGIPNSVPVSFTTASGVTVWEVPVSGFVLLRARISNYAGGTVTVTGHAVPIGSPSLTSITGAPSANNFTTYVQLPNGFRTTLINLRLFGALGEVLGDAVPIKTIQVNAIDPCVDATRSWSIAISQAASAQILTGQPGRRIVICAYTVVGADAENISIVEGTGAVCATNILAVVGATTAANGMNFAANGGVSIPAGMSWVAAEAVLGNNICLLQSGSGRVAGSLKYAFQ